MAHRIVWSRRAIQDLEAIADYIAKDSPIYASILVRRVLNQTKLLAQFPNAGRRVPELDDEHVRELIVTSYRIIYRVENNRVTIAAVIHGRQMLH